MGWKYIIVEYGSRRYPLIFPDALVHEDMARMMEMAMMRMGPNISPITGPIPHVVSGGRVRLDEVVCTSGSETLQIKKNPNRSVIDETIIQQFEYQHGLDETPYPDAEDHNPARTIRARDLPGSKSRALREKFRGKGR